MSWFWLIFAFGFWPFLAVIAMLVILLLFFTGTVSVDGKSGLAHLLALW